MKVGVSLVSGLLISVSLASAAAAYEKLPATATPMPAAELTKAYSGKTVTWKDGQIYWGGDGKVMGYSAQHNAIADGTWDVVDGKVCYHASWLGTKPTDTPYPLNNCYAFKVDGKRVFHQFTSDKMKSDEGWWTGPSDLDKLKDGNTIQSKYDALKAKMPKS